MSMDKLCAFRCYGLMGGEAISLFQGVSGEFCLVFNDPREMSV